MLKSKNSKYNTDPVANSFDFHQESQTRTNVDLIMQNRCPITPCSQGQDVVSIIRLAVSWDLAIMTRC